jgi:hypothetical protein
MAVVGKDFVLLVVYLFVCLFVYLFVYLFRFVTKPAFMLSTPSSWNPNEPGSIASSVIKKIEVEIISARQLPKPGQTSKVLTFF